MESTLAEAASLLQVSQLIEVGPMLRVLHYLHESITHEANKVLDLQLKLHGRIIATQGKAFQGLFEKVKETGAEIEAELKKWEEKNESFKKFKAEVEQTAHMIRLYTPCGPAPATPRETQRSTTSSSTPVPEGTSLLQPSEPASAPSAGETPLPQLSEPVSVPGVEPLLSMDNFLLSRKTTTVVELVKEWFDGVDGRPSVVSMNARSRKLQESLESYYKRRKALIKFILANVTDTTAFPGATIQDLARHLDDIRRDHKMKLSGFCGLCQNVKNRKGLAKELRESWAARPHLHAKPSSSPSPT